jgi:glycosyltransferase involved in cell wall biosynthesis
LWQGAASRVVIPSLRVVKVAIVSTPFVRVPPRSYGGTELVIHDLARGLARAGHIVTLFATGDSEAANLRFVYREAVWPPTAEAEQVHCAQSARDVMREQFDLVHAHTPGMLAFADVLGAPLVYTMHHDRDERRAALYRSHPEVRYVAISARQGATHPEVESAVVHHGLDPERYPPGRGEGDHAAFLGRLAPCKGPDIAIAAARSAGVPIRLAGEVHREDATPAWRATMARALRQPGVEHVGPVSWDAKALFLGAARALLMPVRWEEPFGLVMIEAMLCGTPVIAFVGGATPEIVDDGVTGFLVQDEREMAAALRYVSNIDRAACRRRAQARFSSSRMVHDYERVYARAAGRSLLSFEPPEAPTATG